MIQGTIGTCDERKSIIVDIVDGIYKTMVTYHDATALLLLSGRGVADDRFFFSDEKLCRPFMKQLSDRFVKPEAKALAPVLQGNAEVKVSVATEDVDCLPVFKGGLTYSIGADLRICDDRRIPFRFDMERKSRPPQFTLTTETGLKSIVPEYSPRSVLKMVNNHGWQYRCLQSFGRIFAIYWISSIRGAELISMPESDHRVWSDMERNVAASSAERSLMGIRDFLRSGHTGPAYVPSSYRKGIEEMVNACIFPGASDPRCQNNHNFAADYDRFLVAFKNADVRADFAELSARYGSNGLKGSISRSAFATVYPQFVHEIRIESEFSHSYKTITFMSQLYDLTVEGSWHPWNTETVALTKQYEAWWDAVTLVQIMDCMSIEEMRCELKRVRRMVRAASMYYEFMAAVRNLCAVDILAASV